MIQIAYKKSNPIIFSLHCLKLNRIDSYCKFSTSNAETDISANNSTVTRHPRKTRDKKPLIQYLRKRNEELEKKAQESGLSWRILGATALHNYPILLPEPEPWEIEMQQLRDKLDDMKREEFVKLTAGTSADFITADNPSYEDIIKTMPFQPASRITEADLTNNRKTTDRKLDKSLYLIVKRNRLDNPWQFPQGKLLEEETLRKGCERIIDRAIGNSKKWFLSNSPMGHYCYEYPPEIQSQRKQFGAKVYFMRSQYLEGQVKLETRLYTDFAWITRDEVKEYFHADMVEFITAILPE